MNTNIPTNQSITRRNAIGKLAALSTISVLPSRLLGLNGQTPPSEEVVRGIIGCGTIFRSHTRHPGRILALCDVDKHHLKNKVHGLKRKYKDIKGYDDFRELIARPDIDIVHIATPPHWHAYMAIAAAQAGKAVWGEKPMSRTMGEGLIMKKAIQDAGVAFRVNTWFRFKSNFYGLGSPARKMRKVVMHKLLGDGPYKVYINGNTGFSWKQNWLGKKDLPEEKIPKHLDYDSWLGPAPYVPYNPGRVHVAFRGYWDYDGGGLGDMGQHYLDPVQYILGKDDELPVSVEVDTDKQDEDVVGIWRSIKLTYADGTQIILGTGGRGEKVHKGDCFIEGPKGKIMRNFKSDVKGLEEKLAQLPDPPEQVTDFVQAIKEKKKFCLNESNAFHSCCLINMSKVALRTGKNLKFDPKRFKFNDAAANALIHQPERDKWSLKSLLKKG